MSIISTIGRRSIKVQALLWSISLLLVIGGLTMVYPFLLMISGSSKSSIDVSETKIIPAFLTDDDKLYSKAVEGLFNEFGEAMQSTYDTSNGIFRLLQPPKNAQHPLVKDWTDFIKQQNYPFYYYGLGFTAVQQSRMSQPLNLRKFKQQLYDKYNGDIDALNKKLGTDYTAWNEFQQRREFYLNRREMPNSQNIQDQLFWKFKVQQPLPMRYYFSPEGYYKAIYLRAQYTKNIAEYNQRHGTDYASWGEVTLPRRYPVGNGYTKLQRQDWEDYVRSILNMLWIRVDERELPNYHRFLQAKYPDIADLNRLYGTTYKSHTEIPLIKRIKFFGSAMSDWAAFIAGWYDPISQKTYKIATTSLYINSAEWDFRDYLKQHYKSVDNLNQQLNSSYRDWRYVFPPQQQYQYGYIKQHTKALRWEFVKRNFVAVADYILLHGRGVLNTVIYCGLAILGALIVNPLAAYALSRFKPPSTYKVLLFIMLTMAFPPMVTQIPNFLMLRELGLLNSYAALILPALANGYSIFLLKGFFDSLPRELYESAQIDGASEIRLFLQITMSLSKPILAVIALQTFQMAYSNFMMALLLCQDQRMWTLMPWLYQLQLNSNPGIIFSSLLIAAIPTFLIFIFCQNIIMRGIVVPVEK
jgi:ABC-type glycerol-3-phosphate transport system permease component